MYHHRDHKEALEMLRKAGFTHWEVERLMKFRHNFVLGIMDLTPTEYRRLEFARWLFLSGRLSDG